MQDKPVKFYVKDKETGKRFAMIEQSAKNMEDSYFCGNCYFYDECKPCPNEAYCIQDNEECRLYCIYKLGD